MGGRTGKGPKAARPRTQHRPYHDLPPYLTAGRGRPARNGWNPDRRRSNRPKPGPSPVGRRSAEAIFSMISRDFGLQFQFQTL